MHLFLGGLDCCVAHGHTDKDFNYCVRGFGGQGTRMCECVGGSCFVEICEENFQFL